MNSTEIVRKKRKLDALFKRISDMGGDAELQAHWACYLCVLVSGFLETSVQTIYGEYAKSQSSPKVAKYVSKQLDGFQNAKMTNIITLAEKFHSEWAVDLKLSTDGELKDAVDSVLANRHRIAHGDPVDLTFSRIESYYKRVVQVIEIIEKQCT